jgi:hypothetical protein
MSTLTTVLIVVAVAVVLLIVAGALYARRRAQGGGRGALRRRFGPEYERVLARHDGDARATDRELQDRVRRHGDLTPQPLAPGVREQYDAEWAAVQERFVDSPRSAVAEADSSSAASPPTGVSRPPDATRSSSPRCPSTTPATSRATERCTAPPAPTPARVRRACARRWSTRATSSRTWSRTVPPTTAATGPDTGRGAATGEGMC